MMEPPIWTRGRERCITGHCHVLGALDREDDSPAGPRWSEQAPDLVEIPVVADENGLESGTVFRVVDNV